MIRINFVCHALVGCPEVEVSDDGYTPAPPSLLEDPEYTNMLSSSNVHVTSETYLGM